MTDEQLLEGHKNEPGDVSAGNSVEVDKASLADLVRTPLGAMTLSMFEKGQYVRVRVGSAHNSTELYEHAFESADEANTALIAAGILREDQIPDPSKLAGTGIQLDTVTAEQLEAAGLKRHLSSNL